jgi:hypothetical protein
MKSGFLYAGLTPGSAALPGLDGVRTTSNAGDMASRIRPRIRGRMVVGLRRIVVFDACAILRQDATILKHEMYRLGVL